MFIITNYIPIDHHLYTIFQQIFMSGMRCINICGQFAWCHILDVKAIHFVCQQIIAGARLCTTLECWKRCWPHRLSILLLLISFCSFIFSMSISGHLAHLNSNRFPLNSCACVPFQTQYFVFLILFILRLAGGTNTLSSDITKTTEYFLTF